MYDLTSQKFSALIKDINSPQTEAHRQIERLCAFDSNVLVPLLLCTVNGVESELQTHPLFSHLSREDCATWRMILQRSHFDKTVRESLKLNICAILSKQENLKELVQCLKDYATNPKEYVAALEKLKDDNTPAGYYRAVILSACAARGYGGVAVNAAQALNYLQRATTIARGLPEPANLIFAENMAKCLENPQAFRAYCEIKLIRFSGYIKEYKPHITCSDNDGCETIPTAFSEFLRELLQPSNLDAAEIEDYRQRTARLSLIFKVKRDTDRVRLNEKPEIVMHIPGRRDYNAPLADHSLEAQQLGKSLLADIDNYKKYRDDPAINPLIDAFLSKLSAVAAWANQHNYIAATTAFYTLHFEITGSPDTALILARLALRGRLSSNGVRDDYAAQKYYGLALQAAIDSSEILNEAYFQRVTEILKESRQQAIELGTDYFNSLMAKVYVAARTQSLNLSALLQYLNYEGFGETDIQAIYTIDPDSKNWFAALRQLNHVIFVDVKKSLLLKIITTFNQKVNADDPLANLNVIDLRYYIINFQANYAYFATWQDKEARDCLATFVRTLKNALTQEVLAAAKGKQIERLSILRELCEDLEKNSPQQVVPHLDAIPNYLANVHYWINYSRAVKAHPTNDREVFLKEVVTFCRATLNPPRSIPLFATKSLLEQLKDLPHREAYFCLAETYLSVIKTPGRVLEKETIVSLGEYLIRILIGKTPPDNVGFYRDFVIGCLKEIANFPKNHLYAALLDFYYNVARSLCFPHTQETMQLVSEFGSVVSDDVPLPTPVFGNECATSLIKLFTDKELIFPASLQRQLLTKFLSSPTLDKKIAEKLQELSLQRTAAAVATPPAAATHSAPAEDPPKPAAVPASIGVSSNKGVASNSVTGIGRAVLARIPVSGKAPISKSHHPLRESLGEEIGDEIEEEKEFSGQITSLKFLCAQLQAENRLLKERLAAKLPRNVQALVEENAALKARVEALEKRQERDEKPAPATRKGERYPTEFFPQPRPPSPP